MENVKGYGVDGQRVIIRFTFNSGCGKKVANKQCLTAYYLNIPVSMFRSRNLLQYCRKHPEIGFSLED
jgi:hypothetical protein